VVLFIPKVHVVWLFSFNMGSPHFILTEAELSPTFASFAPQRNESLNAGVVMTNENAIVNAESKKRISFLL
jgi:hypothetical protein